MAIGAGESTEPSAGPPRGKGRRSVLSVTPRAVVVAVGPIYMRDGDGGLRRGGKGGTGYSYVVSHQRAVVLALQ